MEPFVSQVYFGNLLAGTDEAGRGPLAGEVVAAAVILDPARPIIGLADSKKLSEKKREALFVEIQEKALAYGIASATIEEIDEINILHASMLAMSRAVALLSIVPEHVLVDGNRIPPNLPCSAEAVVKGDARQAAISAASILAKVTRDRDIVQAAQIYPEYGFEKHKGYPTAQHLEAIRLHGITPIHRRSFGPVKKILEG
jgi:ribonuclease HII